MLLRGRASQHARDGTCLLAHAYIAAPYIPVPYCMHDGVCMVCLVSCLFFGRAQLSDAAYAEPHTLLLCLLCRVAVSREIDDASAADAASLALESLAARVSDLGSWDNKKRVTSTLVTITLRPKQAPSQDGTKAAAASKKTAQKASS